MKKLFYVYQLRAENEETPFYIGKGSNYRCKRHCTNSSLKYKSLKNSKIKSLQKQGIKIVTEKLFECENQQYCFNLESLLIALYGRKDIGTGILTNHTDGGEGISGYKYVMEEKRKNKLIEMNINKNKSNKQITKVKNSYDKKYSINDLDRAKHIINWQNSSISIREYCKINNIKQSTFTSWMACKYVLESAKEIKKDFDVKYNPTKERRDNKNIKLIEEYKNSGLSISNFAKLKNIQYTSLTRWINKYG